ncbi:Crp/Fnr family transcriptional regulator [Siphonobacter sp. SORGH_AS_1065]|uniref:Crp/Fnr family transcriptional regulator n=1 Tax=Siphonobacter sp. SORGH_AS_1065 TaxID=3041795 RepID=UPI002783B52E|nr:Crp/Fnr family transcriptional regulator [Siphonobacter sp. SORGH_AS_1065]MDQ1087276.1 CRP-like cAMP-binding protein [Siphonobacter sp. SORGH_AS_1065]
MKSFLDYASAFMPLSAESVQAIDQIAWRRNIPKRTILQRAGDICPYFHFIEKGVGRVYYYHNEQEITAWLGFEGQIISAIDSFFTGKPTDYWIEILEDAQICSICNTDIDWLFTHFPETERLGRLMITENYLRLDERMKLFAFHTAEQRYEILLRQFPDILQRVSLRYIASYLGITQVTLSRIRAEFRQ